VLTRRQKEVLDYLRQHIAAEGIAPSLEEIGRKLGLGSLATVHKHLERLEERGAIRRLKHRSRALEIVPPSGGRAVQVPLLGIVAAGTPIEPIEQAETTAVPEELLGRGETFALRVRGDSMIDDGILDGDLVIVEAGADAPTGATVVALVRGEATVKRLRRERGHIRLEPANDRVASIVARPDEVEIRGVVVAVLRRYR
jgi:repressor LexA